MTNTWMPPADLKVWEAALRKWQSPSTFIATTEKLMPLLTSIQFFNDGRLSFARDAWVGAHLASITSAGMVRLVPDQWPDYEERHPTQTVQYEITQADLPGRKIGAEYKAAVKAGSPAEEDPVEHWAARAALIPDALRRAAHDKANKGYPDSAKLVIHLMIDEWGIRQQDVEASMASATMIARDAFEQVLVLWKACLYLLWDHGQPSDSVTVLPRTGEVDTTIDSNRVL